MDCTPCGQGCGLHVAVAATPKTTRQQHAVTQDSKHEHTNSYAIRELSRESHRRSFQVSHENAQKTRCFPIFYGFTLYVLIGKPARSNPCQSRGKCSRHALLRMQTCMELHCGRSVAFLKRHLLKNNDAPNHHPLNPFYCPNPWLHSSSARNEKTSSTCVWHNHLDRVTMSRIFRFAAQNVSRKSSPSEIMATILLLATCQL